MKLARLVLAMVLGIVLPLALQLWDRRRLSPKARRRAWNTASWGSALYAFGPLSMLGWGWVTRPRWHRVLPGPIGCGAILLVLGAIDALFGSVVGLPSEGPWWQIPQDAALVTVAGVGLLVILEALGALGRTLRSWRRPMGPGRPPR